MNDQPRDEPQSGIPASGDEASAPATSPSVGADPLARPPGEGSVDAAVARRSRQRLGGTTITLGILVLVGLAFAGGAFADSKWGSHTTTSGRGAAGSARFFGQAGSGTGGAPAGSGARGNATIGTVQTIGPDSLTLKTVSGDTVTVKTTGSTTIRVSKSGTLSDLAKGQTVIVAGTTSGSTVTARSITEGGGLGRPGGGGFGQGGSGQGGSGQGGSSQGNPG